MFLEVKFSIYLNRRVFIMSSPLAFSADRSKASPLLQLFMRSRNLRNQIWVYTCLHTCIPITIHYKYIAGRYRPVRLADGPITARYRFIKNASWDVHCFGFVHINC